jgi:gliding motility-associated-like protein
MKRIAFIILLLALQNQLVWGQAPVINSVDPLINYPTDTVVINGSGFSGSPSQLQVWFGGVKGEIKTSTPFSIKVAVPAQATFSNIEVVNLLTKLSAKAPQKFLPTFSGVDFTASNLALQASVNSTDELWDLCGCDFNNDGKTDLVSTRFQEGSSTLLVMQNESTPGNISFTQSQLNVTFRTDHPVCGDLDGDGNADLVISRAGSPRNSIHIFKNAGGATVSFVAPINLFIDVSQLATRLVLQDLNSDGKPEIIVSNSGSTNFYVFTNQSSGGAISFNPTPIKIAVKDAITNYGIQVQDLNGDKLPDVLLTEFQTNNLFILKNQSSSTISFAEAQKIKIDGTFNKLATADFNKDGLLDVAVTSTLSNQPSLVLINTSDATTFSFGAPIILMSESGPWGIDISDIDGDGDPDIFIGNRFLKVLHLFLHNGNFNSVSFTKVDIATNKPVRNVWSGDLDSDGKPDIAITSFETNVGYSLDVFRNKTCLKPVIRNEVPLAICAGQTITLRSVPGLNVNFVWNKGGTEIQNNSNSFVDITTAGTYDVTAVGEGGTCSKTSTSITVVASPDAVPTDPKITTTTPVCSGSTITLNPSFTGSFPTAVYNWSGPNGFTSTTQSPTLSDITSAQAGEYSLKVSVGNCRSDRATKIVEVSNFDNLNISSTSPTNTICQGSTLNLSVNNVVGYTYQWKKDGADLPGQTNFTVAVSDPASYHVKVTNPALNCSRETSAVTTKLVSPPVAQFTVKSVACIGETLTFTNSSQTDNSATVVNTWNFNDTGTSTDQSPTHAYTIPQSFNPSLTVKYEGVTGCSSVVTNPVTIKGGTLPAIESSTMSLCPEQSTTLSLQGTFNAIAWSTGESVNTITINAPGTYSVDTQDEIGCEGKDEIIIEAKMSPVIEASAERESISSGESVQLFASGADTYVWEPVESLSDATIGNPMATPENTTLYTVSGTVTDGCTGKAEITINVDGTLHPPLAFSPNEDGINDAWYIQGIESYSTCTLSVFDGRGRRIYQQTGYTNDWKGTYEGKQVPNGNYYYVFGCPDEKPLTGTVLIIR